MDASVKLVSSLLLLNQLPSHSSIHLSRRQLACKLSIIPVVYTPTNPSSLRGRDIYCMPRSRLPRKCTSTCSIRSCYPHASNINSIGALQSSTAAEQSRLTTWELRTTLSGCGILHAYNTIRLGGDLTPRRTPSVVGTMAGAPVSWRHSIHPSHQVSTCSAAAPACLRSCRRCRRPLARHDEAAATRS